MGTFNEENKITIAELAPSLVDLLNAKALAVDLTSHVNDADRHITPAERVKWNKTLDDAKSYTDSELSKALGPIRDMISGTDTSLTTLLNSKLDKAVFDNFRTGLAAVATSGSYNDLKDQPSALSYSDTANKALRADRAGYSDEAGHAKTADEATHAATADSAIRINGIRITIGTEYPTSPQNNKEFFYHTTQRMLYVYTDNGWQMTGAALR